LGLKENKGLSCDLLKISPSLPPYTTSLSPPPSFIPFLPSLLAQWPISPLRPLFPSIASFIPFPSNLLSFVSPPPVDLTGTGYVFLKCSILFIPLHFIRLSVSIFHISSSPPQPSPSSLFVSSTFPSSSRPFLFVFPLSPRLYLFILFFQVALQWFFSFTL
jgi:hypothetical protein